MSFTPRTNSNGLDTLSYYTTDNPFYPSTILVGNCTWYAWGRFWEEAPNGGRPRLSLGDAYMWYGNTSDNYQRSNTPKLGAVICFSGGNFSGLGHVAVVEQIYEDGSILVSESGYNGYYFRTNRRYPSGAYPYSNSAEGYTFQGFIYNPNVMGGDVPPEPSNWITGNYYLSQSERDNNAIKFYYTMTRLGVSYNAIIGMLANIDSESTINPGIWESLIPYGGGYGLVQWTPYTKYSNWVGSGWENNGQKECERIIYEAQNGLQWFSNAYAYTIGYPTSPPISLNEYLNSNLDYHILADYWLLYYEHPREDLLPSRQEEGHNNCDYYDQLLGGGSPPTPVPIKKDKLLLYVNKRKFMKRRGLIWR